MTTSTTPSRHTSDHRSDHREPETPPGRWTRRARWIAGLWALVHLPLAVLCLLRDTTAPWTPAPATPLAGAETATVATGVAVLAVLTLVGLALGHPRSGRTARLATGAILLVAGLGVALVVADTRTLQFLGYSPMLVLALAGIGPGADHLGGVDWTGSLLSVGHSLGGLALIVAGAGLLGHGGARPHWWTPRAARLVGGWAVAAAVAVPMLYALTRIAWALGVPLGVREAFLDDMADARFAGLGLALFAVVGSLLTLGLAQRWGEVFWSWLPVVGGRPVPVMLAVVPALVVASVVLSAGLGFVSQLLGGSVAELPGTAGDWATWAPTMAWPLWGIGLSVAALAYRERRLLLR